MFQRRALLAVVVMAATMAGTPHAAPSAQVRAASPPSDASRLIAIGDIHGAYPQFVSLLEELGLLDDQGRWAGGRTTLVQTGDFTDRGLGVRPVMDLLMTLERQAEAAGGQVIVLLGNHETMNLTHLNQDVSPYVYATFADDRSESRRQDAYKKYQELNRRRRRDLGEDPPGVLDEEAWMEAHPPGFFEYFDAFGPEGLYGRWLRQKDVVVKVDDTIFLHGGLNPEHVDDSLDDINDEIQDEIKRFDHYWDRLVDRDVILPFFTFYDALNAAKADLESWLARMKGTSRVQGPVFQRDQQHVEMLIEMLQMGDWLMLHEDGPLWFRGFASWSAEEGEPMVDELLERYDARRIVVGHTVSASRHIVRRFDGRVFLIDTGMLTEVYQGRPSALEITDDHITAVYLGEREVVD